MGKFLSVTKLRNIFIELIHLETFESIKNSDSPFLKLNRIDSDSTLFLIISTLNFKNTDNFNI